MLSNPGQPPSDGRQEGLASEDLPRGKRRRRKHGWDWDTSEGAWSGPPQTTATSSGEQQSKTAEGPSLHASQLLKDPVPTTSQAEAEPVPMMVDKPSARIARLLVKELDSGDSLAVACPHLHTKDARLVSHYLFATAQDTERQMKAGREM